MKTSSQTISPPPPSIRFYPIWANKEHGCSFEAIEAQLHHNIGTKVTRSYLRTDFLKERYDLLEWWERYLTDRR